MKWRNESHWNSIKAEFSHYGNLSFSMNSLAVWKRREKDVILGPCAGLLCFVIEVIGACPFKLFHCTFKEKIECFDGKGWNFGVTRVRILLETFISTLNIFFNNLRSPDDPSKKSILYRVFRFLFYATLLIK